ncbi:MAG: hypothetical protein KFF74_03555, partial [Candidatus Nanosynbacter sp.]|nr:hypothetical protein [Candidatus Nanosynbacter sp.]
SSNITITLANKYDPLKLKVYRRSPAGNLQDATGEFTIKSEVVAGKALTTVLYNAVDADDNDSDSSINYAINGVFYFGVVDEPISVTPNTPTAPSAGSSSTSGSSSTASSKKPEKSSSNLAETGNSIWLVSGLAVIAVVAGGLALRKRP